MNSHKTLPFATILGTFILILLFALAATGCGTGGGATGSATPTSSSSTTPTTTAAQKCGTIGVRPGGSDTVSGGTKADVAGNCFWQAFQQCHAASLTVNFSGVDTITTHTFTVQKKDTSCAISDAVQHRIVPQPAKNAGTFTCSGLVNTANELHFTGCGTSGDIIVPMK